MMDRPIEVLIKSLIKIHNENLKFKKEYGDGPFIVGKDIKPVNDGWNGWSCLCPTCNSFNTSDSDYVRCNCGLVLTHN